MKVLYKISLFFTVCCITLGLGLFISYYQFERKIGDEKSVIEQESEFNNEKSQTGDKKDEDTDEDSIKTSGSVGGNQIRYDTKYMVESLDAQTDIQNESSSTLPERYIGMTKIQLEKELELYSKGPTLKDEEKGFISATLQAFSQEKIVVRKTFDLPVVEEYYLAVKDNFIVVYENDKKTVYLNTSIFLDELPSDLQIEIMNMKHLESEVAVYDFLESHSS